MERYYSLEDLEQQLESLRKNGQTIGLVPTMGALHEGHMSLIERGLEVADTMVCSIFVNPTQFNEAADLNKYPRTEDQDCKLLEEIGCDLVFLPEVARIYPENHVAKAIEYLGLDQVMEGAYRLGHFDGVVEVVARLFDIVSPDFACFGEKDFQQLAVVRQLVVQHDYPVEILPCPIIREPHGLAMSSRNERLTAKQREQAAILFATLKELKGLVTVMNPDEVAGWGREQFRRLDFCELEYLEVAESETLQPIYRWHECESARAFVAVRFGEIRLIDNMEIYRKKSAV
jgi:pantoate--beta-alanine ligase